MDKLGVLCSYYLDLIKTKTKSMNRFQSMADDISRTNVDKGMSTEIDRVATLIIKEMKNHVMGDWMPKGLGGVRMAIVLSIIGNPWRFPGQKCTKGHHWPLREFIDDRPNLPVGSPCLFKEMSIIDGEEGKSCVGTMLAPERGTGVSHLWSLGGFAPDKITNRLPRRQKGQQAKYNSKLRTQFLMPDFGIADQVIKHKTPIYRELYDTTKTNLRNRLIKEGIDEKIVNGKAHSIARVVISKAILGDLLMEWKKRTVAERGASDKIIDRPIACEAETVDCSASVS
jgi:hypothetical protein